MHWKRIINKPQAWLSWSMFWLASVGAWVQTLVGPKPYFLTLFFFHFLTNFIIYFNQSKLIIFASFFTHLLFNIHILTILKKITKKDLFNMFLIRFKMIHF